MKKFSDLKKPKIRRLFEQDEMPVGNLPQAVDAQVQAQSQSEIEVSTENAPEILGEGSNPAKFFSKLFESREMAHVYHLQVKGDMGSFAAHTALGEYYNSVLELIDELIETYQGQYDIITGYDSIDTSATSSKDKLEYFKELVQSVIQNR
jgi:hypothetical protein